MRAPLKKISTKTETNKGPSRINRPLPTQISEVFSLYINSPIVQRTPTCPCGGGCPQCRAEALVQPKLRIIKSQNIYEREADQTAERVIHMPETGVQRQIEDEEEEIIQSKPVITPLMQRQIETEEELEEENILAKKVRGNINPLTPQVTAKINVLQESGQPLSDSETRFFEPRFGADFLGVRVHNDTQAADVAKSVNARAFTFGRDIVFGAGEYHTDTADGKKLLAHELTHVVQQNKAGGKIQRQRRRPRRRPRRGIRQIREPKLSLYQSNAIAGTFFRGLALRKARRIRALQIDTTPRCPTHARYGPTSYGTGADIIAILAKTYRCTGNQIRELHIFSHGNTDVVAASEGSERTGIYSSGREQRAHGGRSITDIPQEVFSSNAAIVLHGCSIASGDDSFAELFLRRLLGGRRFGARVYGHSASGVCGRSRDWREFSRRHPEGRRVRVNPFHR